MNSLDCNLFFFQARQVTLPILPTRSELHVESSLARIDFFGLRFAMSRPFVPVSYIWTDPPGSHIPYQSSHELR